VQAEGTSEFIENQLQQAKKTLDDLEVKVSQYKLQHNGELPQQEASLTSTLARLQLELQGSQDAINRAQQNKLMTENALSVAEISETALARAAEQAASVPVAAGATMTGSPQGATPRKNSEALLGDLAALRLRYSDDHPEVKRLRAEIARVQAIEVKEKEAGKKEGLPPEPQKKNGNSATPDANKQLSVVVRPEAIPSLIREHERVASIKTQLALAERELQIHNEERQRILRSIASYQARLDRLPIREQEMASVTRDYEIAKANYRSLLDKKLSAGMATEMERRQKAERFTVLDPARVPEKPFKPDRPLLGGLACALGFVLSMAVAAGREFKKGFFLGEWELPSDIFILGRVPRIIVPALSASGQSNLRQTSERKPHWLKWRIALISSLLLSVLGGIAATIYFAHDRF